MLFSCHIVHIRYSVGCRQTLANTKWINATSNNLKHDTMNGAWKWSCIILGWYLTKIISTSRILGDDEMWLGLYFNFGKSVKINITLMSGVLGDDKIWPWIGTFFQFLKKCKNQHHSGNFRRWWDGTYTWWCKWSLPEAMTLKIRRRYFTFNPWSSL